MVAMRPSFAGERPFHEELEGQIELQSQLMDEMGRNAAQAQAAPYGTALPTLPSSVPDTRALSGAIGSSISGIASAFAQKAANDNSNRSQQSQQPQQQDTSMWSSYAWPSITDSYLRRG